MADSDDSYSIYFMMEEHHHRQDSYLIGVILVAGERCLEVIAPLLLLLLLLRVMLSDDDSIQWPLADEEAAPVPVSGVQWVTRREHRLQQQPTCHCRGPAHCDRQEAT